MIKRFVLCVCLLLVAGCVSTTYQDPTASVSSVTFSSAPAVDPTYEQERQARIEAERKRRIAAAANQPDALHAAFGQCHALVIGINAYRHLPRLRTAVNDAKTLASLLEKDYGYKVHLLTDTGRSEIIKALRAYRKALTGRDNLLIYYAGHGWLDEAADEGYWLPVDATKDNEANWISAATVTAQLRAIQAKHILVVADSCYSGKLTRGLQLEKNIPDYIQRAVRSKSRTVLASGGLEPVEDSSGGQTQHSAFAAALIDTLRTNRGVLTGLGLFGKIRRPVMVNADQTPEYGDIRNSGHDGGDFLFMKSE